MLGNPGELEGGGPFFERRDGCQDRCRMREAMPSGRFSVRTVEKDSGGKEAGRRPTDLLNPPAAGWIHLAKLLNFFL